MTIAFHSKAEDAMNEALKGAGVIAAGWVSIGVAQLSSVKEWVQVLLLVATLVFTALQSFRVWIQLRNQKKVKNVLLDAQRKCEQAQAGYCPVSSVLESMVAKKD